MEALSVDMGRLKSGEVNLGVRSSDIVTSVERLIEELVYYLDIDYGRPVQGRGHHRRRQSNDHRFLHRTSHPTEYTNSQLQGSSHVFRPIV